MRHIMDHPETHLQGVWTTEIQCGTAACMAGWTCLLSGYEIAEYANLPVPMGWGGAHGLVPSYSRVTKDGGSAVPVRSTAANLLGLTPDEAETLFSGANTAPMLQLMVNDLVNGDELQELSFYQDLVWGRDR